MSGRPIDLPPAERFAHGTCARYVTGCRCRPCRNAIRDRQRERAQKVREARAEVKPNALPPLWMTLRRGRQLATVRACPGTGGRPCVKSGTGLGAWVRGTWLKNGEPLCTACVDRAAVWNGLVPADRVRRHLLELRAKGVGYKAVAAACDVHPTRLNDIIRGVKKWVRAQKERRILAVDEGARADGSQVPAARSFAILDELHGKGFTWAQLSRELGFKTPTAAATLRHQKACAGSLRTGTWHRTSHEKDEVLASTALRIEKLYRRFLAGELHARPRWIPSAPTWHKIVLLLHEGFTAVELSRRLGGTPCNRDYRRKTKRIRPETAEKVAAFYDAMMAEGPALPGDGADVIERKIARNAA